ncbi:hypothetical protein FA95DRAFT_1611764 [Auriscalpium vulgare]|uniref:Uncharacterized protein n=1 Tax=Auriscalpium vulgare TaxID=40419 RepID=A0ACB8R8Q8_9AGAM|nr:hypothetical protein FA95DRAFT_1611764 [Auriscalpium vulgare]
MEPEPMNPEDDEDDAVYENFDPDFVELSVVERQQIVSERLQLMDLFGIESWEPSRSMYPPQTLSPHDKEELSFLRSLAIFVVGNSSQDQLAVTRLRTTEGPLFLFAMNRDSKKEDRDRVDSFFSLIQKERSYLPYMQFALERSSEVIEERIQKLQRVIAQEMSAVSDFLEHFACPGFDVVALADRLRGSEYPLVDIIGTFHGSDFPATYTGILRSLQALITAFTPSPDSLAAITMSAALLELMVDTLTAELPAAMRNLRFVLSSVARYGLGTSILIKLQAQFVPGGQVSTSWEHRLPYLELPPPLITIRSPLAVADSFEFDLMGSLLSSRPPPLRPSVKTKTSIKPILHAEIRLVSFWHEHSPRKTLIDLGRLRIGSSSDTCACCEVWLRAASRSMGLGLIAQSSGRFHGDWAISGMAMPTLLRACDDNVQKLVLDTLTADWMSSDDMRLWSEAEDTLTETGSDFAQGA